MQINRPFLTYNHFQQQKYLLSGGAEMFRYFLKFEITNFYDNNKQASKFILIGTEFTNLLIV